jgi:hypothetical protein
MIPPDDDFDDDVARDLSSRSRNFKLDWPILRGSEILV